MFPVYGFRLTIFRPFGEHISQRGVVNNAKVTSYDVVSRIIYEWRTCTSAIRRDRFKIVNIEIMQHIFYNYNLFTLLVRAYSFYRHGLILKIL